MQTEATCFNEGKIQDDWENWANDIANIAKEHIDRINGILVNSGTPEREAFDAFLEEIRDDLNPEISESDAVEMLAQHIITRPVFDSLFLGNRFTSENAVSKAMETVLGRLYEKRIDTKAHTLERFYESVKMRANGIVTANGRQTLIKDLYDRFFRNAFPMMTQRLGIVYTPTEVVDFITHSVEDVLRDEFDSSLADDGVHILDPFSGTGTFIARLMQSGLIPKERLSQKYKNEIHANEIVLLAYYIACINIEAVYDDLVKENQYQPFNGMVLTDTFQLYEQERDMIADLLPDNSQRRTEQKKRNITVIIGNPPYSAGQGSANDNAANIAYPNLDNRIETTYAVGSSATNKNSLYDSYIKAFRWASDRIGDEGIIAFVTNAGWVDGNATDGFRKCLGDEFTKIYLFHLRGNARTSGELRRKEKGNVFGEGTRTPIVITVLVKTKDSTEQGQILFHDIGDYLGREQKLAIVKNSKSISNMMGANNFVEIQPDDEHDWLNQGDKSYKNLIIMGSKDHTDSGSVFENYSNGLKTQRDAWCYNASRTKLLENVNNLIKNYNSNVARCSGMSIDSIKQEVDRDPKRTNWSDRLYRGVRDGEIQKLNENNCRNVSYRPFTKTFLYHSNFFNERQYQMPKLFPDVETKNKVICVTGSGTNHQFSCLLTDTIADVQFLFNGQCFPIFMYENDNQTTDLLSINNIEKNTKFSAIKESTLEDLRNFYGGESIQNHDLFYYIYGILHSPDYRERFENDLRRDLPRIPFVKSFSVFKEFSVAGKKLGDLHAGYETIDPYHVTFKEGDPKLWKVEDPKSFYRVKKMKYAQLGKKSSVKYNENITIQNIPIEASEYRVNGKPALEWVMDRQCISTNKSSGIVNDANDYANETMNNPAYPLELFQRVITVSLETMKIVRGLPELDID